MLIAPVPPPAPAESVRTVLVPVVRLSGASTVMFPARVPVGFDVLTVTDEKRFNTALMVEAASFELSAVGVQTSGERLQMTFEFVFVMSMLESGSSSHCPAVPLGAAALTTAVGPTLSVPLPEVSMVPPLPPA